MFCFFGELGKDQSQDVSKHFQRFLRRKFLVSGSFLLQMRIYFPNRAILHEYVNSVLQHFIYNGKHSYIFDAMG